jgi:hypothetical protein
MSHNRYVTVSAHGVVELVFGLATLVSPFLLRFDSGGILAAVALGSLLIGLGVSIGDDVRSSLGSHHLCDLLLVLATGLVAFALAVAGQESAALFFAVLAVLESGLNVATRYVTAT